MKTISSLRYISGIAIALFALACEKVSIENPDATNELVIEFDNRVGAGELSLGNTLLTNASGENYTISTLNYFVSNIKLMSSKGVEVDFSDKYFLIKESDSGSQMVELKDVPAGEYTHLSFTIGVDSLKSISDVSTRTGVLDVGSYGNDNMYWSWNMGYIFFKMEGNSPQVNINGKDKFEFHIGGFGGKDAPTPNNLKEIELYLSEAAKVSESTSSQVHVIFDVSKVMDGTSKLKLSETPMIHNPMVGKAVSANYSNGFLVDHVHEHHAD